ncbi:lipid-A-disaccharide synthase [Pseudohalocynthiibacter aestuariivivens]|uniref:Lipid-A-disaccharide synthase n=1 Tax=Pseudohalocynthiibacter aestuariivivens TaxID=1591409 RepID=A0ABV5JGA6_9RHOB|nr:lipid-A-disaccharide synthase [Pseudohalocynthiibacter aestuariivivens]MBS9716179.1 lipid-A-disaccharide synthase [Pseudohalocynthiibacter aestuariivivens]
MRFFLVAGEPSGDRLGAALMAGLKMLVPEVQFHGVGGPLMQAEGLDSLFPMAELSVMGIAEVAPRYFQLKRRIRQTADAVLADPPDALITIDSPDFCLRVAKLVKAGGDIRTVHYVAPTVWAWRPGRAVKMARTIDHVLALFPFEKPLMEVDGMRCDFVGHPVVAEPQADASDVEAFREKYGIGADETVLLALPGSRQGEVSRLMEPFGQAIQNVLKARPDIRIVVPAAGSVVALVKQQISSWPGEPILLDPRDQSKELTAHEKRAAFRAADIALAASGTVSLELAASQTPMVIAYDMNWITRQIVNRMLMIDTVTLVNIVSETRHIPEFIGAECIPTDIAKGILSVLENPQSQKAAMALTMKRLGQGSEPPGLRAAKAVLDGLRSRPTA